MNVHVLIFAVFSKKHETKINVHSFTETCSAGLQARVAISQSQVMILLDKMCDDVELPAPPICPNLPVELRRCSVGAAFSCVITFNTNLLSHGPSLIWRDWCT